LYKGTSYSLVALHHDRNGVSSATVYGVTNVTAYAQVRRRIPIGEGITAALRGSSQQNGTVAVMRVSCIGSNTTPACIICAVRHGIGKSYKASVYSIVAVHSDRNIGVSGTVDAQDTRPIPIGEGIAGVSRDSSEHNITAVGIRARHIGGTNSTKASIGRICGGRHSPAVILYKGSGYRLVAVHSNHLGISTGTVDAYVRRRIPVVEVIAGGIGRGSSNINGSAGRMRVR